MATQDVAGLGLFVALYVALQIGLGMYLSRGVKTDADYFLAGRNVGLLAITFSIFATWFSAETIIGSAGAIAEGGLAGGRGEPFGYAACLIAMALFVAAGFRAKGYDNLAAFFRDRFSPTSELFTALITIVVSTIWAAAQLLALAVLVQATFGVDPQWTLLIATAIIMVYTATSGIVGDIYTDMVHGCVLIVGLLAVLFAVAQAMGGLGPMLARIEPQQLQVLGEDESWLAQLDEWAIPILGSLVTQEVIARFLSAKTPQAARTATFAAGGMYLVLGLVPVLIALSGTHLVTIADGEAQSFLPVLAAQTLPTFAYILFAGAMISAVMSTTNSNVLSVSSMVSLTLLSALRRGESERARLCAARASTIGACIAAYIIASSGQTIVGLIELTSVFGQSGILIAVLIGLHSAYGGRRAALWAILAGLATNVATLVLYPVTAMMTAAEPKPLLDAVFALAGDEAPAIDGYFLYSVLASLIGYVAGAEADRDAPHKPA